MVESREDNDLLSMQQPSVKEGNCRSLVAGGDKEVSLAASSQVSGTEFEESNMQKYRSIGGFTKNIEDESVDDDQPLKKSKLRGSRKNKKKRRRPKLAIQEQWSKLNFAGVPTLFTTSFLLQNIRIHHYFYSTNYSTNYYKLL